MQQIDLKKQTITKLHKDLLAGEYSAVELAEAYFKVIAEFNPKLNAYLQITKELALEQAHKVDTGIKAHAEISPIAGIPTALKDNFNIIGTNTTASSHILEDYVSPYNATVSQRLLDAGAVITGKTNMDAFAHGSSTETSDFGVSRNPYNTEHVPGGSSGGSAVAVAADMCTYSIGSETAGSVRGPAAWCNLYGFAPTYGRFSRYGLIAMGSSLDRPGILANSVKDIALVADVLAGTDVNDATSIPEAHTKYDHNLTATNTTLKLGVPKQFLDDRIDPETQKICLEVIKQYEKLGAKIVKIDLLDPKYAMAVYTIVMRSEVSSNLARIDGIRYGHNSEKMAETILEQLAFNRGEGFGTEAKRRSLGGTYTLSAGYYDAYYKKAQKVRTLIIEDFKKAFLNVDLIIGPTMPGPAPVIGTAANDPLFGDLADILTEPSALAGLPCISMPAGLNKAGLPIGVQLFGPQLSEQAVLNAAYIFETRIAAS
jgi:aspartyl-tRNA(Asn)/glutamyl-tRNA(Gln) amidotransferase subunit A